MKVILILLPIIISIPVFSQTQADTDSVLLEKIIFDRVEVESSFPGGVQAWRRYLEKNLNPNTPVDHGAPAGTFLVIVQFVVDKEGNISDVRALTHHGYGMEEEVIRIIAKGPQWIPAMQNNRVVKAYRKQPVTFVVAPDGFNISIKNGNTLYTNTENFVTITADKVKSENLSVSISQGTITHISDDNYIVKVNSPGRAIITLYNKKKQIGSEIFDVKSN